MVWDVTVISTLADSYVSVAARGAGEVAELAATKKCLYYRSIRTAVGRVLHHSHYTLKSSYNNINSVYDIAYT